MKARSNRTGNIIEVDDRILKENPGLFTPVDSSSESSAPQESALTSAGKFGGDLFYSLLSPFIKTGQNILTAGQEGARSIVGNKVMGQSNEIFKQLTAVNDQLKKEKDPNKKKALLEQSRQLSNQLSGSTQAIQKVNEFGLPSPLVRNQQEIQKITTPSGAAEEIARNTAGIASYGINPTGGGLMSQILKSAVQGGLSTASREGTGATEIGGGALLGGALGGVLGVAGRIFGKGAKKVLDTEGNDITSNLQKIADNTANKNLGQKVAKFGSSSRQGVLNPQVSGGAFYKFNVDEMNQLQAGLNLKGGSEAQLEQVGNQAKYIGEQIKAKLQGNKTQILTSELKKKYLSAAEEALVGVTDKEKNKINDFVLAQLKSISEKGSSSGQAVYDLKSKFGDLLKRAFKKQDVGTALAPKEEAYLAAFHTLKDSLDTVSPAIKSLNTLENKMYELSTGLIKSTKMSGIGGDFFTSLLRSQQAQGLADALGRGAIKTGGAMNTALQSPLGKLAQTGVNLGQRVPGQVVSSTLGGTPATQEAAPETFTPEESLTTGIGTQPKQSTQMNDLLRQALLYDLAKNGGKQATEIKVAMDMIEAQGGGKKTEAQKAASDVGVMIKEATAQLPKIKRKVGIAGTGGKLNSILSKANIGDQDLLDFSTTIANIKSMIAKARAGTAFTETEENLLNKYTPNENDSYQDLVTKLKWLSKQPAFNR